MSIDTTGKRHVALYDTVSGQAIGGPIFSDAEQADDFVEWAGDRLLGKHPDYYPPAVELMALYDEWRAERLDENDCLREGVTA